MKLIFFLDIFKTFYFALGNSWLNDVETVSGEQRRDLHLWICMYMYGHTCIHSPPNSPPIQSYETDFKINRIENLEDVNGIICVLETL